MAAGTSRRPPGGRQCAGYTRRGHATADACRGYSEDCLNLNIWTPSTSSGTRAVMVWIHGGGYAFGGGADYNGSTLAATHGVLVLTINYRLGFLGG